MSKRYVLFIFSLLLLSGISTSYAQTVLPSAELEDKIRLAANDSEVVKILLHQVKGLVATHSVQNYDEAIKLNNRAIIFAEKNNYLMGLSKAYEFAVAFSRYKHDQTAELTYKQKLDKVDNELDKLEKAKLKLLETQNKQKQNELETAGLKLITLSTDNKIKEQVIDEKNRIITGKDTVINRQKLENLQKEQLLKLARQEGELKDLKFKEQQTATRFLFVVSIGIAVIFLILLYIYFSNRRYTRQIAKEKERSDDLLQNILPISIAEELKNNGSVKTRYYDNVTVLFTDFEGFTKLSEKMTSEDLVKEIDYCYTEFDSIIMRHGLEKIKTIGDAYMCAAGLPEPSADHALRAVRAAVDIVLFIDKLRTERIAKGLPHFNIRVGLNTGPVVAGVVGTHKFAYDIWGDTVNVAARLESASEIGRVNISHTVYELVKHDFTTQHRGKVMAKNKGEIDMYFVN